MYSYVGSKWLDDSTLELLSQHQHKEEILQALNGAWGIQEKYFDNSENKETFGEKANLAPFVIDAV